MGLLSGLLDGWLHGWGLPILVAATAVVIPATYYRSQWHHAWFWMVIVMLIVSKPLMDQLKFVSLVGFAILDASLVVVAVNWMSPKSHEND
jgi:phosphatidylserine synthase